MRLIDADKLFEETKVSCLSSNFPDWFSVPINEKSKLIKLNQIFMDIIREQPAVDAVPVVRCKDCKKSGLTEFGKRYCSEPMGTFYGCIPVEDDFFCSGGVKKDVEANGQT